MPRIRFPVNYPGLYSASSAAPPCLFREVSEGRISDKQGSHEVGWEQPRKTELITLSNDFAAALGMTVMGTGPTGSLPEAHPVPHGAFSEDLPREGAQCLHIIRPRLGSE